MMLKQNAWLTFDFELSYRILARVQRNLVFFFKKRLQTDVSFYPCPGFHTRVITYDHIMTF